MRGGNGLSALSSRSLSYTRITGSTAQVQFAIGVDQMGFF